MESGSNGMTINERLFAASLFSDFDVAVKSGDRPTMVRLLVSVGFTKQQADQAAVDILVAPEKYGYDSH